MCVGKPFMMTTRPALFWSVQRGSTAESANPQVFTGTDNILDVLLADGHSSMGETPSSFSREALGLQFGVANFSAMFEGLNHKVRGAEN